MTTLDDRPQPHSLEAEKAVLGAVLMHGVGLDAAAEHVKPLHFFRDAHKRIFTAMQRLATSKTEIDLVTLKSALMKTRELDAVGGPVYLAQLMDGVPRSMNVGHYAQIVREHADRRAVIQAASTMLAHAYEADEDAKQVLDQAEQALFALTQGETTGGFTRLADLLPGVVEQIEGWAKSRTGVSGVATGFVELDQLTRGLQRGNLVILAARPAMGKTGFALNVALHAAQCGHVVGVFSLEMSDEELAIRALTGEARVDSHRLQRGFIRDAEWAALSRAMAALAELDVYVDDSPFVTVFDIRSRSRRLRAHRGALDLLIVDYAQLLVGEERRESRVQELSAITRGLKALSKDLNVPVLALSQLSRDLERRENKRPVLSDLRESGSFEQDADVVMFIYRDEVYNRDSADKGIAELIVGKQRQGPIGTVKLAWLGHEMRFANLSDVHGQAEPEDRQLPMSDR